MHQSLKKRLIGEVIDREGGYVNHEADRGGPTRYGITEAVARDYGYTGDMRALPLVLAHDIYADRYWHSLKLDKIATIHEPLATYLFDYGVNSGPGRPAETLQRLLNVLNRVERDYDDIAVDGAVGPATIGALEDYHDTRGRPGLDVLAQAVNALRIEFMVSIAEARESQEAFTYGWLSRVIELSPCGEGAA
ncbi:glycosyl hydrolase 108 family protein [Halomonas elongata]|uniref:glycoside hydrolase family 108 protein n=1 Tax=Halomonas elongata TaxID=2746 RepID=UPI002E28335A|nr:glycosyl hydrolase 108 family protein [Halomonas elongata]WVI72710.1 glycosyl hydrolase 108 family protein [Halomonas elongata]